MQNNDNDILKKDFLDLMFEFVIDEEKNEKFQLIRNLKKRYIDLQPSTVTGFNLLTPETIRQLSDEEIVDFYNTINTTVAYIRRGDIKTAILSLNNIPYKVSLIVKKHETENQEKTKVYA